MKFHWKFIETNDKKEYAQVTIPAGNKICGLTLRQKRPNSVELTYEELKYLLNNEKYAVNTVLLAIYTPRDSDADTKIQD